MKFKPLKEVLNNPLPDMIDCDMDFENLNKVLVLKVILRTLWKSLS